MCLVAVQVETVQGMMRAPNRSSCFTTHMRAAVKKAVKEDGYQIPVHAMSFPVILTGSFSPWEIMICA